MNSVKLCAGYFFLSKQLSCCEQLSVNINLKSIANSTDQYKQFIGLVPKLFFTGKEIFMLLSQKNFCILMCRYISSLVTGVNSKISPSLLP